MLIRLFCSFQIDDPIHVISMPDEETMQQKPPDYDTVAGAPPTYDDAIKLNPARLLPASSSARHEPPRTPHAAEAAIIPGQPEDAAPVVLTPLAPLAPLTTLTPLAPLVPVHRSQVPKTPPPPYNPTHAIR